jgi:Tfp pilus assembly protein PilO
MMSVANQQHKVIVRWGLGVILALDLILLAVSYQLNVGPRIAPEEVKRLEMLEKSYRADNARLNKFRAELPADEKEWDEFFTTHFRPAGAGYSAVSEDLGQLSQSAGLRTDTISFHQHAPDARGLMEIEIATAVEGNYESLVNFLDKLEHSTHFYVLDGMTLASSNAGKIRLNIQLRTYFRT